MEWVSAQDVAGICRVTVTFACEMLNYSTFKGQRTIIDGVIHYESREALRWMRACIKKTSSKREPLVRVKSPVHTGITIALAVLSGCLLVRDPAPLPDPYRADACVVKVTDALGQPVEGAKVYARKDRKSPKAIFTDSRGVAVLRDDMRGIRTVVVVASGMAVKAETHTLVDGGRVSMTLARGRYLRFRVVDPLGNPVVGALVDVRGNAWVGERTLEWIRGNNFSITDSEGRVSFEEYYEGRFEVNVSDKGTPLVIDGSAPGSPTFYKSTLDSNVEYTITVSVD